MMFRKIILILMNLISSINCNECDCRKYVELEIKDVASIKKSDLPADFSDEAFKVVDEFIRKTNDLDNEILLYFDHITGEILKCKIGSKTNVKLKVEDEEFARKHISSIHNHTKDMYSPPSDKNFGIFSREWEDYELISGIDGLWILKGKLKDDKLTFELKTNSQILFRMVLDYHSKIFSDDKERNDEIDKEYGKLLSNYINNKNKKEIQLSKREYNNDS